MAAEMRPQREGVDAVQSMSRLLALDDLWTTYLDHADRDDVARDLPDLEALVSDMKEEIAAAQDHVRIADEILATATDAEVRRAVDSLTRDQAEDWSEVESRFLQSLAEFGPRRSLMAACRYVDLAAEEEMGLLNAKVDRIRNRKFERGDLSHRTKCGLDLAIVACGVAACVVSFPAGCITLAAAAFRFVRSWEDGCQQTLPEIWTYVTERGAQPEPG